MRELKNFSGKSEKAKTDKTDYDDVKDYIGKYDGFSEDQLIEELIKNVKKSKASGTYNNSQMKTFLDVVSPQMSEQQRTKLNNLIKLIEEDEI